MDRKQKDLVRNRFTKTAEVFGSYSVPRRAELADWLARAVRAGDEDRAVDLACGPGTLALRFARHVRWICGLDLTPAMLERARQSAAAENLANLDFAIADAQALPFPDGALDLAVTSFSLHHMPDPARVSGEMTRVVRRGGRVGIVDIRASEDPRIAERAHRIERARDDSHTRSLPRSEFEKIFAANRLRILAIEPREEARDFDNWMHVAGWKPGDAVYAETRRLMEESIPDDSAGFQPQLVAVPSDAPEDAGRAPVLRIVHSTIVIAAEKI